MTDHDKTLHRRLKVSKFLRTSVYTIRIRIHNKDTQEKLDCIVSFSVVGC